LDRNFKTGVGFQPCLPMSALKKSSRAFVKGDRMASSHSAKPTTALVCAVALGIAAVSWAGAALASQGPGAGQGTASGFTQLAMAVLVYGASALVIGAGLIGAVRRH
jgi:hypothetical protein